MDTPTISNTPVNPDLYHPQLRQAVGAEATIPSLSLGQSIYASAGLNTPIERLFATSVFIGAGLYALKPGFAFDQHGSLPFALTASPDEPSTWTPWWLVALGGGVIAGQFL